MQHAFQAEVRQLLDLVVHSLYTDREVFLRELVSNASDSLEKLRHRQLTGAAVAEDHLALEIHVNTDDSSGTVTITDFGVGLTRDEMVENLGTIAHSGTKAFLAAAREAASADGKASLPDLIGQFGVGFYSVFMVAKEVLVYSRGAAPEAEHLVWSSDGGGTYVIEEAPGQRRGAKIVVKLKDDAKEFASESRVEDILRRYSNFVPFPILLNGRRVNTVGALWRRSPKEVTEEEYKAFFEFNSGTDAAPHTRLHVRVDAPLDLHAILYVPAENPERYGLGRTEPGVALHCRKVLIDAHPEGLLPPWLRFVRGVVDSDDLPLNVSRESMQDSALLRKLNNVLTKRLLKHLAEEAKRDEEKYLAFHRAFGGFLREGVVTDFEHREALGGLLRFESSVLDAGKLTSLAEAVSRLGEGKQEILYLVGRDRATCEANPVLEAFKRRGREVLFLYEPVEELVMSHLGKFDGKNLKAADHAEVEADDVSADAQGESLPEADLEALCEWLKTTLGDRFAEVKGSRRLVDRPAVALNADRMMSPGLRRLFRQFRAGSDPADPLADEGQARLRLEINPRHALVKRLAVMRGSDADLAAMVAEQLADNALLAAGFLDDARPMVGRLEKLLDRVAGKD